MNATLETALLGLLLFEIKHYLADFVFQTLGQVQAKGHYGRWGGISHAGLHALMSLPALLVLTATADLFDIPRTLPLIAAVMLAEFAVHYHIDYAKARIDRGFGWDVADQEYWIVFGTDQFLHQMTYWVIVWWMVR